MAEITLRDGLAAALEAAPEEPVVEPVVETPEQAAARDEKGRFTSAAPQAPEQATVGAVPPTAEPPAVAAKPPSSWKKDYWDDYAKMRPEAQAYIEQREREFANGVSVYKSEAEQAREIRDAMAPFVGELQQAGVTPSRWLSEVGQVHRTLTKGTPEQQVGAVQGLLGAYRIPARLVVQDPQGQWQFLNQQQPQPPSAEEIRRLVQQEMQGQSTQQTLQQFLSEVPMKYPHYEAVKGTMVGLLQSGLSPDLQSAYEAALRLPAHADIYQQVQQQHTQEDEAKRLEAQKTAVQTARAKVISPKSVTPASNMTTAKKGLRDMIAEGVESATSGRV